MTLRLRLLIVSLVVTAGNLGFLVGLYGRALYDDGWAGWPWG